MKDIDFDELDKAVNSLMGSVPKQTTNEQPAVTPVVQTVDVPELPALAPDVAPTESNIEVVSRPKPSAPALRRSGGRFMDMVNTPSVKPRPAVSPVSREGLSIAARPASTAFEITPEESTNPVEAPVEEVEETETLSVDKPVVNLSWPDPLEMNSTEPAEPLSQESPIEESEPDMPQLDVPEAPIESPFLQRTKVEKRPLNPGKSDTESSEIVPENVPDEEVSVSQDESETPRSAVPAELDSDLVAIESGELKQGESKEPKAPPTPNMKPDTAPAGPASIAQQYREQPSSGDQSHAPIYDTSQHASPLLYPAKKKAGWLWIVWVVLLLALGAGGAVALYMAGLI